MIDALRSDLSCFSTPIQHRERNDFHEQDQSWRRPGDRGILRHRARDGQSLAERGLSRIRNQPSCLRRKQSDGVTMLTCDVTDDASVAKLVDDVLAKAGRIDLLVNNAGMGLLGGAEESSIAQAQALFDVNVFGVFRVTNAVLPAMRRQGKGRIVNLSSVQGFIPAPYFALYSSTKHAIEGYSESLDHELRPFGIRVSLVEPAYTRTSFEDNLAKPDQLLDIYDSARAGMNVSRAESDGKRRYARSRSQDHFGGCDRSRSEEALCGRKNGAPGQSPAPFRPRSQHSTRACESSSGCRSDVDTTSWPGFMSTRPR